MEFGVLLRTHPDEDKAGNFGLPSRRALWCVVDSKPARESASAESKKFMHFVSLDCCRNRDTKLQGNHFIVSDLMALGQGGDLHNRKSMRRTVLITSDNICHMKSSTVSLVNHPCQKYSHKCCPLSPHLRPSKAMNAPQRISPNRLPDPLALRHPTTPVRTGPNPRTRTPNSCLPQRHHRASEHRH